MVCYTEDFVIKRFIKSRLHLSPPQRLLLVNTSETKWREVGVLERENGIPRALFPKCAVKAQL